MSIASAHKKKTNTSWYLSDLVTCQPIWCSCLASARKTDGYQNTFVDEILWKVLSRSDIKVKMQKLFYGKCLHNNPMKMSTHFSAAICWQADPGIFQKSVGEIWRQKSNFSKKSFGTQTCHVLCNLRTKNEN